MGILEDMMTGRSPLGQTGAGSGGRGQSANGWVSALLPIFKNSEGGTLELLGRKQGWADATIGGLGGAFGGNSSNFLAKVHAQIAELSRSVQVGGAPAGGDTPVSDFFQQMVSSSRSSRGSGVDMS